MCDFVCSPAQLALPTIRRTPREEPHCVIMNGKGAIRSANYMAPNEAGGARDNTGRKPSVTPLHVHVHMLSRKM